MPNIIFTHSKINKKFNNTQIYKLPERNFTNLIYQNINRLGYKFVLVEGGSKTISKFLENRLLNIMSSKRAMKQAQKQAYAKHRSNITNSRFEKKNRNSIKNKKKR